MLTIELKKLDTFLAMLLEMFCRPEATEPARFTALMAPDPPDLVNGEGPLAATLPLVPVVPHNL